MSHDQLTCSCGMCTGNLHQHSSNQCRKLQQRSWDGRFSKVASLRKSTELPHRGFGLGLGIDFSVYTREFIRITRGWHRMCKTRLRCTLCAIVSASRPRQEVSIMQSLAAFRRARECVDMHTLPNPSHRQNKLSDMLVGLAIKSAQVNLFQEQLLHPSVRLKPVMPKRAEGRNRNGKCHT